VIMGTADSAEAGAPLLVVHPFPTLVPPSPPSVPSLVRCTSAKPAAHIRHSTWPSKPSWAQPLNVLTLERVRTTPVLIAIPATDQRNSCYSLVPAFRPLRHQPATHSPP
jgi:hypothetical protein